MNVFKDGEHIANSPFKLQVGEGNASKVKAWGKGLEEGTVNEVNEFTIDTKDAGQTPLQFYFFLTCFNPFSAMLNTLPYWYNPPL